MALSRTARILIAGVLLAAAAFFWLNFFQQNQVVEAPPTAVPATTPSAATTPSGTTPANLAGTPAAVPPASAGGAATTPAGTTAGTPAGTTGGTGAVTGNGIVTTPEEVSPATGVATPSTAATPVVVADPPAVVLRDLVVDQLPFLVTEPPQAAVEEEDDQDSDAARSVIAARANVNPFSPIVVQAPPAAAQQPVASTPLPEDVTEPDVVVVSGSPEPTGSGATTTAVRPPVAAPAPRTVAPASTRTAELPRPLPSGTLSSVPDILQTARTQPSATGGPANLSTVAAVVVPEPDQSAELPFASAEGDVAAATSPEPIGPGHVQQTAAVTPSLPLAVGADPLSRYLRDNNVRFTGQVLGPLSVGVFRSNLYQQPAVVLLGQTLPDSEILLSDLRGYEARFTLGQNSQVLSLDTRR